METSPRDQTLYELERRRRVAESLGGILAMLNSNQSLEDTLEYIVRQASPLLGADAAAIYRLQQNGVFVNPLKLNLPPAKAVEKQYQDQFAATKDRMLQALQMFHD